MKIGIPEFKVEEVVSILSEVVDWGLTQNSVPDTWNITKGEGVNIFVLDTAGYSEHPDIKPNLLFGVNLSKSDTNQDRNGHGTHTAGIISSIDNGVGVVGVAPRSKVALIKVLDDRGLGTVQTIANGLKFCYECAMGQHGSVKPDIVSMSLGAPQPVAEWQFWIKKLYELNIPVICAAGNNYGARVSYPAAFPECIAVAAYDKNGKVADFSNKGSQILIGAPGVDVYSTWPVDKYAILSGTSEACPFISGIVALMLAKHRKQEAETGENDCKTVEQIKSHIKKYSTNGVVGRDGDLGYGLINVIDLLSSTETVIDVVPEPVVVEKKRKTLWQILFG